MNHSQILLALISIVVIVGTAYTYAESVRSTAPTQQFSAGLVEARQKCQTDAQQWFSNKMAALTAALNTNDWNDQLVGAHFNSRLNTCLVAYMYSKKDGSMQTSQVIDIYQNWIILELDINTAQNSPTAGVHLYENTKPVQLWPWQSAVSEYSKKENVLFEGESP